HAARRNPGRYAAAAFASCSVATMRCAASRPR
ncbi:hypothetical protein BMAFMH_E0898, partial [Burkholderia mallei FMH]